MGSWRLIGAVRRSSAKVAARSDAGRDQKAALDTLGVDVDDAGVGTVPSQFRSSRGAARRRPSGGRGSRSAAVALGGIVEEVVREWIELDGGRSHVYLLCSFPTTMAGVLMSDAWQGLMFVAARAAGDR